MKVDCTVKEEKTQERQGTLYITYFRIALKLPFNYNIDFCYFTAPLGVEGDDAINAVVKVSTVVF